MAAPRRHSMPSRGGAGTQRPQARGGGGRLPSSATLLTSRRKRKRGWQNLPPSSGSLSQKVRFSSNGPGPADLFYCLLAPKPPATVPLLKLALNSPTTEPGATLASIVFFGGVLGERRWAVVGSAEQPFGSAAIGLAVEGVEVVGSGIGVTARSSGPPTKHSPLHVARRSCRWFR